MNKVSACCFFFGHEPVAYPSFLFAHSLLHDNFLLSFALRLLGTGFAHFVTPTMNAIRPRRCTHEKQSSCDRTLWAALAFLFYFCRVSGDLHGKSVPPPSAHHCSACEDPEGAWPSEPGPGGHCSCACTRASPYRVYPLLPCAVYCPS